MPHASTFVSNDRCCYSLACAGILRHSRPWFVHHFHRDTCESLLHGGPSWDLDIRVISAMTVASEGAVCSLRHGD